MFAEPPTWCFPGITRSINYSATCLWHLKFSLLNILITLISYRTIFYSLDKISRARWGIIKPRFALSARCILHDFGWGHTYQFQGSWTEWSIREFVSERMYLWLLNWGFPSFWALLWSEWSPSVEFLSGSRKKWGTVSVHRTVHHLKMYVKILMRTVTYLVWKLNRNFNWSTIRPWTNMVIYRL